VLTLLLTLLVILALVQGTRALGERRWASRTRELEARLESLRRSPSPARFDPALLEGLPEPVRRYLNLVLQPGQPLIAAVRLEQEGSFEARGDGRGWRAFRSRQRVIAQRPGFLWDARVQMFPGVAVHVHDAYLGGEGLLHPALQGLLSLMELRGPGTIAEGELLRFLAESPWYPTVLLPSQGVCWEPLDGRSARATLRDGETAVSLDFHFGPDGRVDSIRAEARPRLVGRENFPTPWEGRWWDYAQHGDFLVPTRGEVSWVLPDGPRPYWRGHLSRIEHELAT
jgi:hypothetical protein